MRPGSPHRSRFSRVAGTLLGLVLVGTAGCAGAREADVPFRRMDKKVLAPSESDARLEAIPAQVTVFANETEWAEFCARLNTPPAPNDFSTHAIAAAFAGTKPSSGYAIEIRKITFLADTKTLVIAVADLEPPTNAGTLTVLTFPYDLVVFPRPGEWTSVKVSRERRTSKP